MTDKKKSTKKRKEEPCVGVEGDDKPSAEEIALAKWMRRNVPIKKTKFLNHNVEYFTASKAVDELLHSEWACGTDPLFVTREDISEFLNVMLQHKFFHRARKVPVSDLELKAKRKDKKKDGDSEDDRKKCEDDVSKERNKEEEKSITETENGENENKMQTKDKRKRKIRLDMHHVQRFVDGLDAYVWIYEPIPFYYWICGTLIVLGVIGVCLFPLWPPSVRMGVYYLSIAAAGFLVFIIVLAVLRLLIFCFVWVTTLGTHHIWILPNLTEDVGFFASFWPLYTYEYKGSKKSSLKVEKENKGKEKDSDEEESKVRCSESEVVNTADDQSRSSVIKQRNVKKVNTEEGGLSGNESESSQRSSTGKDFEIVEGEDIQT